VFGRATITLGIDPQSSSSIILRYSISDVSAMNKSGADVRSFVTVHWP